MKKTFQIFHHHVIEQEGWRPGGDCYIKVAEVDAPSLHEAIALVNSTTNHRETTINDVILDRSTLIGWLITENGLVDCEWLGTTFDRYGHFDFTHE